MQNGQLILLSFCLLFRTTDGPGHPISALVNASDSSAHQLVNLHTLCARTRLRIRLKPPLLSYFLPRSIVLHASPLACSLGFTSSSGGRSSRTARATQGVLPSPPFQKRERSGGIQPVKVSLAFRFLVRLMLFELGDKLVVVSVLGKYLSVYTGSCIS